MKKTYVLLLSLFAALSSKAFSKDLNNIKKDIREVSEIGVGDATCYGTID